MKSHYDTDADRYLKVRVFLIRTGAFFVEEFCQTPDKGGGDGENKPHKNLSFTA
jgi:hypothetical protein